MLYYERIVQPGVYLSSSPRGSEETLKPRMNGSNASLHTVSTDASVKTEETAVEHKEKIVAPIPRVPGARIVRNVSAQRSRSLSVSPPSQNSVLSSGLPHPLASVPVPAEEPSHSKPLQNGDASHHHSKPRSTTSPNSSPKKKPRSKASLHPEHNTPPTELHMMSSTAVCSSYSKVY